MVSFIRSGGLFLGLALAVTAFGEGPAKEIGGGAATVGTGAAKGAGNVAKGTGEGVADVVTLHPVKGATSVGKGAVVGGKDLTVGAAKGTGKIGKGIGKFFKKVF